MYTRFWAYFYRGLGLGFVLAWIAMTVFFGINWNTVGSVGLFVGILATGIICCILLGLLSIISDVALGREVNHRIPQSVINLLLD